MVHSYMKQVPVLNVHINVSFVMYVVFKQGQTIQIINRTHMPFIIKYPNIAKTVYTEYNPHIYECTIFITTVVQ